MILLVALLMAILIPVLGLSIDIGILSASQSELRTSAEKVALSAVQRYTNNLLSNNGTCPTPITINDSTIGNLLGGGSGVQSSIECGDWDFQSGTFLTTGGADTSLPYGPAVRVTVTNTGIGSIFGRLLGLSASNLTSTVTAAHLPVSLSIAVDVSKPMQYENYPSYELAPAGNITATNQFAYLTACTDDTCANANLGNPVPDICQNPNIPKVGGPYPISATPQNGAFSYSDNYKNSLINPTAPAANTLASQMYLNNVINAGLAAQYQLVSVLNSNSNSGFDFYCVRNNTFPQPLGDVLQGVGNGVTAVTTVANSGMLANYDTISFFAYDNDVSNFNRRLGAAARNDSTLATFVTDLNSLGTGSPNIGNIVNNYNLFPREDSQGNLPIAVFYGARVLGTNYKKKNLYLISSGLNSAYLGVGNNSSGQNVIGLNDVTNYTTLNNLSLRVVKAGLQYVTDQGGIDLTAPSGAGSSTAVLNIPTGLAMQNSLNQAIFIAKNYYIPNDIKLDASLIGSISMPHYIHEAGSCEPNNSQTFSPINQQPPTEQVTGSSFADLIQFGRNPANYLDTSINFNFNPHLAANNLAELPASVGGSWLPIMQSCQALGVNLATDFANCTIPAIGGTANTVPTVEVDPVNYVAPIIDNRGRVYCSPLAATRPAQIQNQIQSYFTIQNREFLIVQ